MRLVLRADVTGVGHRGDIVDVAGGFARKFLLPSGRAIVATKGIEAQAGAMRRSRDIRARRVTGRPRRLRPGSSRVPRSA